MAYIIKYRLGTETKSILRSSSDKNSINNN